MKMKIKAAVAASAAGVLALTACSASGSASSDAISVVGYSVLEAANKPVFTDFENTSAGKDAQFRTSYGASGDQSRAVDGGLDADVVHFSLETDVTRSEPATPAYTPTKPTSRKPAWASRSTRASA